MGNTMIQTIYQNAQGKQIVCRKAAGSGDYSAYPESTTHTINSAAVSFQGQNGKVSLAT